jgi:hypothetical protein
MRQLLEHEDIAAAYTKTIQQRLDEDDNLTPFFVTTTFKSIPLDDALSRSTRYPYLGGATWSVYSRFYRHMLSQLMKNWQKKRHLMPLTYDFLDVPGTRFNKHAAFTENTYPHVHSIYLVHDDVLERFMILADTNCITITSHHIMGELINDVKIKHVKDIGNAVRYCSKFLENMYFLQLCDDAEVICQQPKAKCERSSSSAVTGRSFHHACGGDRLMVAAV